jgi:hypothetical protein
MEFGEEDRRSELRGLRDPQDEDVVVARCLQALGLVS